MTPQMRTSAIDGPWAVVRRLVSERWQEYWPRYLLAFALMTVASGATALSAWLMKDVVNEIFVSRNQKAMIVIPLVIAGVFIVKGIATYFQEVWLSRIGNKLVADYQRRIFDRLLVLNVDFFQDHKSSDLIMRSTKAAASARSLLNLIVLSVGRDALTLFALVIVMMTQDPLMSLIVLTTGPIAALAVRQMGKITRKAAQVEAATISNTIAVVKETAQGVRIVKSFQLEDVLRRRMGTTIEKAEFTANRVATVRAGINPLIEVLGGLSVAGIVAYAGWQATATSTTPGNLFAFITALLLAADPARRLSRFHLELKSLGVGVGLMFDVLDTPQVELARATAPPLRLSAGRVHFEDVRFSYPTGGTVLDGLSFSALKGQTTALVGPSGGGKSTIFGLLQGFWWPDSGRITIDDQSLDEVLLASWRKNIALVSQDVFLFDGSIRDNIMAARPTATEQEFMSAVRAAYADEFIERLPQQFDSIVGELGNLISGGQRQRISIARAFLKKAPILLLDEPTSALDSESEKFVQDALEHLAKDCTTIVIAHRFATVLRADMIYAVDRGQIVEAGTHAQLLENKSFYSRLYHLQFGCAPGTSDANDIRLVEA